ncbi:GTP-binding protein [Mycena pura]|uniref:GTP-binding protein n=1 Tax=Mycena pura TaxID=153505 RepID=A0AAD6VTZ1_9AGAR|nr:GTP-binding protein [Mycena pura]
MSADSDAQPGNSSLGSSAQPAVNPELPKDNIIGIRSKCPHFRILIIGRANAGKTTILKRVCNSVKGPEIYDVNGKKVYPTTLLRGEHNIENQMIFKSNPGFIFHDSRGFESGTLEETETVKNFIKTRAASRTLAEQLHAIWYCLPMADTTRPFLKADEDFFDLEGVGNVPVIAIFTKCDGLYTEVCGNLMADHQGMDPSELNTKGKEKVEEVLTNRFKELQQRHFRPAAHVYTQAFAATQAECVKKLVKVTAGAIASEALQLLFVSVQCNNLDLCTFYAIKRFALSTAY